MTKREQWWEGDNKEKKVVHSYVRVMTTKAFGSLVMELML